MKERTRLVQNYGSSFPPLHYCINAQAIAYASNCLKGQPMEMNRSVKSAHKDTNDNFSSNQWGYVHFAIQYNENLSEQVQYLPMEIKCKNRKSTTKHVNHFHW
jgi:hypothetical protein